MERFWQPSIPIAESKAHQELVGLVQSSIREGDIELYDHRPRFSYDLDEDVDPIIEIAREIENAGVLSTCSAQERRYIMALLSGDINNLKWGYGCQASKFATLFEYDQDEPAMKQELERKDLYILSGVDGNGYSGKSKKVDRKVAEIVRSPHEQRVLLGSVATYAEQIDNLQFLGFELPSLNGLRSRIEIGADLHGDFRMIERKLFERVIDPRGVDRHYAPAIQPNLVAGYHSIELYLLTDILVFLHNNTSKDTFVDTIISVLDDIEEKAPDLKVGAFGDWGAPDPGDALHEFRFRISENGEDYQYDHIVLPRSPLRLKVMFDGDNFGFQNIDTETGLNGDPISVPLDNTRDLLLSLVRASYSHGRSSPRPLIELLSSCLEEQA